MAHTQLINEGLTLLVVEISWLHLVVADGREVDRTADVKVVFRGVVRIVALCDVLLARSWSLRKHHRDCDEASLCLRLRALVDRSLVLAVGGRSS